MRIRVLGCSGGSALGREPSCYLFEGGVAVDAGALASGLTSDEQNEIRHVLLTHAHWDHCRDLPLHTINRSSRVPPLVVHGLPETLAAVRAHLFNDAVWFRAFDLPSAETPLVVPAPLRPNESFECERYRVTAFAVPHTIAAVSYIVDDGRASVIVNADTAGGGGSGGAGIFKNLPRTGSPLRAVFLEASFPNRMRDFAVLTGHLTPAMLAEECRDLPADVEVIVTHVKPVHEEEVTRDVTHLGSPRMRMCRDEDVFEF